MGRGAIRLWWATPPIPDPSHRLQWARSFPSPWSGACIIGTTEPVERTPPFFPLVPDDQVAFGDRPRPRSGHFSERLHLLCSLLIASADHLARTTCLSPPSFASAEVRILLVGCYY